MEPNRALQRALHRDRTKYQPYNKQYYEEEQSPTFWTNKTTRLHSKFPQETKNPNRGGRIGVVSDPMDLPMRKKLAAAVALTQGNSPLDPQNTEAVPHLRTEHKKLTRNIYRKGLKAPQKFIEHKVNKKKKQKGGMIFTTMKNRLVNPIADSNGVVG